MFTKEELGTIANMCDYTWEQGGVRSEAQGGALHILKAKIVQMLNPKPPQADLPKKEDGKKKCGKCGGDCGDCGNCGDKGKEEKKPDGPPKAKEAPKKAEG